MRMTKNQAKILSLETWRYIQKHPEVIFKFELPIALYMQVENMLNKCPLCELFKETGDDCSPNCPIFHCVESGIYRETISDDPRIRQKAVAKIIELLETWNF